MKQFGMSRQLSLPGQQKDQFWRAVVLCALTAQYPGLLHRPAERAER